MENLYERNGLVFWTEREIKIRRMLEDYFSTNLLLALKKLNPAFSMYQVEAPILTPRDLINKGYTEEDVYSVGSDLVLRPETTMGSYAYAKHILSGYHEIKQRMPVVVWQHGLSFRKEQDQPTKFMRLKQFYQLEFQILFSPTTANDYVSALLPALKGMMEDMIGFCRFELSDRLPDYSEETTDIIHEASDMEVCSISRRKDYEGAKVIEVAIGTDRCVYHFLHKNISYE